MKNVTEVITWTCDCCREECEKIDLTHETQVKVQGIFYNISVDKDDEGDYVTGLCPECITEILLRAYTNKKEFHEKKR